MGMVRVRARLMVRARALTAVGTAMAATLPPHAGGGGAATPPPQAGSMSSGGRAVGSEVRSSRARPFLWPRPPGSLPLPPAPLPFCSGFGFGFEFEFGFGFGFA
jgi:hypothetical protein